MRVSIQIKNVDPKAAERILEFFVNKLKDQGLEGQIEYAKIMKDKTIKKSK